MADLGQLDCSVGLFGYVLVRLGILECYEFFTDGLCVCALLSDGEEEGEGQGPGEAATADDDTLESLADIEEALENLGQARNLIKAADSKVHMSRMTPPSSLW